MTEPLEFGTPSYPTLESMSDFLTYYTVVGVFPESKERYVEHVTAQSARQAEDLVQLAAGEKGGRFWVCSVFEGQLYAADTYATFVDPDMTTRAEY